MLRSEFARLIDEREELVRMVLPGIETRWAQEIGVREAEVLQLEVEVRRLRREIELIQAAVNHGQRPDLVAIQAVLDTEMAEWKKAVDAKLKEVQNAQQHVGAPIDPAMWNACKKLFRKLAKRLHPDVNPDLTDRDRLLWNQALAAYERAEPESLEVLWLIVDDTVPLPAEENALDLLRKRKADLKKGIRDLLDEVTQIRNRPPYSLQALLDNSEWVSTRKRELEEAAAHLRENITVLSATLTFMKTGASHDGDRSH